MIIFDLDGTLYRTHETCEPALIEMCQRYKISLTEEEKYYLLCTTPKDLFKRAGIAMTKEEQDKFIYEFKWLEIENVIRYGRLFEHVEELLQSLYDDGIEMAICGMGSKEYIEAVLDRCKIRKFFKYVSSRREGVTKSEALKRLLLNANRNPNECLMIGDSITDITAANANGVPFLGVSYGYGAQDISGALAIADDVLQLENLIYKYLIYLTIEREISVKEERAVIGISGVDTSGKTRFAEEFEHYMKMRGYHTQMIHLDDFHNERAIRWMDDSPKGYIDHAFNLDKLSNLVRQLKENSVDIELNLLDLSTDTTTNRKRYRTEDRTIIILEGVMLYRAPIDPLLDYRIYLDISFEEVLRRARIRDVPIYGEEFLEKYENKYIPAQKIYMEQYQPKGKCQLVIDNNNYQRPRVQMSMID